MMSHPSCSLPNMGEVFDQLIAMALDPLDGGAEVFADTSVLSEATTLADAATTLPASPSIEAAS